MRTDAHNGICQGESSLLCPQCGYINRDRVDRCIRCQKHLFIKCSGCGQVNFRGNVRCDECRYPLRHTHQAAPFSHHLYWPFCWRFNPYRKWVVPVQILVFAVAVFVTVGLVVNFPECFQKTERALFPEAFAIHPDELPLRVAVCLDMFTAALFASLPLGIMMVLIWLTKLALTDSRHRPRLTHKSAAIAR
jgi:hypothetical protein